MTSAHPFGEIEYVVMEFKYCEECGNKFLREHTELRKLKDGTVIDPNKLCTRCEHGIATQAAKDAEQFRLMQISNNYASMPRGDTVTEKHERSLAMKRLEKEMALRRMEQECIRKEAFSSMGRALKVARRSRSRHRGKSPCVAYRCTATIDPVMYPDRAKPHFHIGGRLDRKL